MAVAECYAKTSSSSNQFDRSA